jgi:hypothetical protein
MTACSSSMEQTSLPETPAAPQAAAPVTQSGPGESGKAQAGPPISQDDSTDDTGSSDAPVSTGSPAPSAQAPAVRFACSHPAPAHRRSCDAIVRTDSGGAPASGYHGDSLGQAFSRTAGSACNRTAPYCASDLQAAYGLSAAAKQGGRGVTVAVIASYAYPGAASDLGVYRKSMGLPACAQSTGCLRIVNQSGRAAPLPPQNRTGVHWPLEAALDLDMVSAICPNCKLLLVLAKSDADADLAAAVTAAASSAAVIDAGYSGAEDRASLSAYDHSGRTIAAPAGDEGYGPRQPCSFAGVVCVGGTTLTAPGQNGRSWTERAWQSGGSGCSAYVSKPQWQHLKECTMRSEADVAAVADPQSGVAVYDAGDGGWLQAGGTSAASAIVAAAFAVGPRVARANAPAWIWRHGGSAAYRDVTTGSNGSCSVAYFCQAKEGYDGPTGWGTPARVSGF